MHFFMIFFLLLTHPNITNSFVNLHFVLKRKHDLHNASQILVSPIVFLEPINF